MVDRRLVRVVGVRESTWRPFPDVRACTAEVRIVEGFVRLLSVSSSRLPPTATSSTSSELQRFSVPLGWSWLLLRPAADLKTGSPQGLVGSNPTPSALR